MKSLFREVAAKVPRGARVCAAFSGGVDSVVLLEALVAARAAAGLTLTAVHVHHGLSPHADRWAAFCESFCAGHGVAIAIERVSVERASGQGIEAAARAARYAAFARQDTDVIALAHHLDDQAETVLLQLFRGTGLKGVAAMPEWRRLPGSSIRLFRPLLAYSRATLLEHARAVPWIEDESNEAMAFDRNFLRREVAPRLDERFPGWRECLARFARHAAAADELLAALAREDGVPDLPGEPLGKLRSDSPERGANALRAFLEVNALPMPSEARLAEMARQLFGARADARIRIEHAGASLVRHRGAVRVEHGPVDSEAWAREWQGERELDLGSGRGIVRFAAASGAGIAGALATGGGWRFAPRAGGERIRLALRRPTRTLKNLLHEAGVPEWQRERLPLLFHGADLVWVPGVGIAASYQCAPGEAGLVPEWHFPPSASPCGKAV